MKSEIKMDIAKILFGTPLTIIGVLIILNAIHDALNRSYGLAITLVIIFWVLTCLHLAISVDIERRFGRHDDN